jgi:hypothetical protein
VDDPDRDPRPNVARLRTTLGELLADLAQAGEKHAVDRRGSWIAAVGAVWRFLDKLGHDDPGHLKAPFAALAGALRDLDHGTIDPGLKPARKNTGKKTGRPPDPLSVALVRPLAAAWMHFLVQAGRPKPDAGKAVARALIRQGFRPGRKGNVSIAEAGRTVAKWRERLEEGAGRREVVELYKSIKAEYRYLADIPAEFIDQALALALSEALAGLSKESE